MERAVNAAKTHLCNTLIIFIFPLIAPTFEEAKNVIIGCKGKVMASGSGGMVKAIARNMLRDNRISRDHFLSSVENITQLNASAGIRIGNIPHISMNRLDFLIPLAEVGPFGHPRYQAASLGLPASIVRKHETVTLARTSAGFAPAVFHEIWRGVPAYALIRSDGSLGPAFLSAPYNAASRPLIQHDVLFRGSDSLHQSIFKNGFTVKNRSSSFQFPADGDELILRHIRDDTGEAISTSLSQGVAKHFPYTQNKIFDVYVLQNVFGWEIDYSVYSKMEKIYPEEREVSIPYNISPYMVSYVITPDNRIINNHNYWNNPHSMQSIRVENLLSSSSGTGDRVLKLMEDKYGQRFAVTGGGSDSARARQAHVADGIYRLMGVKAPRSFMDVTPDGDFRIAEWVEGKPMSRLSPGSLVYKNALQELKKGFIIDLLLDDRDVFGMNMKNIVVDAAGVPWRTTNGGGVTLQPRHEKSAPQEIMPQVLERLDPDLNRTSAEIYGSLSGIDIADQMFRLKRNKVRISDFLKAQGFNYSAVKAVHDRIVKIGAADEEIIDIFRKNNKTGA